MSATCGPWVVGFIYFNEKFLPSSMLKLGHKQELG